LIIGKTVTDFNLTEFKNVKSVTLDDGNEVKGDKFVICAGIYSKELG